MIPISDSPHARRYPYVTIAFIVANVLVFLYEMLLPEQQLDQFVRTYGLTPIEITSALGEPLAVALPIYFTLVTSMFLHGGLLHIFGNMIFLWVFGDNVESRLGHVRFVIFYFLSGLGASMLHIAVQPESTIPSIGASGAIAGVLAAYLLYYPYAQVRTLIFLIPFVTITRISAIFLIGFWIVIQLFSGLAELGASSMGGVAYWAHVGGFVVGFILAMIMEPSERPAPSRPSPPG